MNEQPTTARRPHFSTADMHVIRDAALMVPERIACPRCRHVGLGLRRYPFRVCREGEGFEDFRTLLMLGAECSACGASGALILGPMQSPLGR